MSARPCAHRSVAARSEPLHPPCLPQCLGGIANRSLSQDERHTWWDKSERAHSRARCAEEHAAPKSTLRGALGPHGKCVEPNPPRDRNTNVTRRRYCGTATIHIHGQGAVMKIKARMLAFAAVA